jgi:hypothetical protein
VPASIRIATSHNRAHTCVCAHTRARQSPRQ